VVRRTRAAANSRRLWRDPHSADEDATLFQALAQVATLALLSPIEEPFTGLALFTGRATVRTSR